MAEAARIAHKQVERPVISERVARAAARALLAANDKLGVESDEKTKRLAAAG